ncbi:FAD-dependent oxidoreductase [Alkalinema sp. FACHB-956]|uniref:NAD(P)/FAD-dependent oxidoreductase n=1 Tax=Alkalinema sp. FACHB-956 TaxID=2692768 RepID=UPI0016858E7C|nr:FAD-dependent oxidoreductase [Alkalinema sp. FACHB-956]MBD2326555.1 FAD-binding oxidoreductase [Alkalinema sp. FACHB-956]
MQVVVIGAGIVGSTIAYELATQLDRQGLGTSADRSIKVLDQQCHTIQPKQNCCPTATAAALGVLMAAISKKEKGRNLRMRLAGVDWYDRVIPDLETCTGLTIPYNRQGILMLQFAGDRLDPWERLIQLRPQQNRRLELWSIEQLQQHCPQLNLQDVIAGVYSPDDRQVDPVALTQALVQGATQQGVEFHWGVTVTGLCEQQSQTALQTSIGEIPYDCLIIAAGLGSSPLTQILLQSISPALDIRPVLGQAIQIQLPQPLGHASFQPVVTGHDIHVVPLGGAEYWVGASVELPPEDWGDRRDCSPLHPQPEMLETVWQGALQLIPELAQAERRSQWIGLRPRPFGRPAPVIEWLSGNQNILLATGHYRNGILLAPGTAIAAREMIQERLAEGAIR